MNNLNYNFLSYLSGLYQTDGSLVEFSRNRGRLSIELSEKDRDIIDKIAEVINVNYTISERTRDTNYMKNYKSISLIIYNIDFRNLMKDWGMISGKKSDMIKLPAKTELNKTHYIRGLYDGDGSIGFTANNFPFVSFTTKSEYIKDFILDFISDLTKKEKKQINRNKRDGIYNITISKEDAVDFCKVIYIDNLISINRKYELAQKIKEWERPINMAIKKRKEF